MPTLLDLGSQLFGLVLKDLQVHFLPLATELGRLTVFAYGLLGSATERILMED